MKLRYATPELGADQMVHAFGQLVESDLRDIYGDRGDNLEATVAYDPKGDVRKFILTLEGLKPKVQVQTFFLPSELQNKRRVKYRVSKAYAELLRTLAKQPV